MTIEEMRKRIEEECEKHNEYEKSYLYYCRKECPLRNCEHCYTVATDEEIKENYELMFKEESKMINEFDFNKLKSGMAVKFTSGSFCVAIQTDEDEITFYERFDDGELSAVCTKEDIINNQCKNEIDISFYPIEIYGYSKTYELFDASTRPLLWKKEEDKNFKIYKIRNLEIKPNYEEGYLYNEINGYKTKQEDFLFIENINSTNGDDEYITINKSQLNDVINALTEIRDFIKES